MAFSAIRPEEPTNINWQSMQIKSGEKAVRASLVMVAIGFLVAVAMQG